MTMPTPANWQTILGKSSPELLKRVTGLRDAVLEDGALRRREAGRGLPPDRARGRREDALEGRRRPRTDRHAPRA